MTRVGRNIRKVMAAIRHEKDIDHGSAIRQVIDTRDSSENGSLCLDPPPGEPSLARGLWRLDAARANTDTGTDLSVTITHADSGSFATLAAAGPASGAERDAHR